MIAKQSADVAEGCEQSATPPRQLRELRVVISFVRFHQFDSLCFSRDGARRRVSLQLNLNPALRHAFFSP
jgi:hypothetical protein